jgi:hypothetical protein
VKWINDVWQFVAAKHHDHATAERDEFWMEHIEGTAIRQVKLEGSKAIAGQLAQFFDVHNDNSFEPTAKFVKLTSAGKIISNQNMEI